MSAWSRVATEPLGSIEALLEQSVFLDQRKRSSMQAVINEHSCQGHFQSSVLAVLAPRELCKISSAAFILRLH